MFYRTVYFNIQYVNSTGKLNRKRRDKVENNVETAYTPFKSQNDKNLRQQTIVNSVCESQYFTGNLGGTISVMGFIERR